MYNVKLPLKLRELNELLTVSSDHSIEISEDLNVKKHIEADYIAQLLIHLELQTFQLNKEVVSKLHSGDLLWPNKNGEQVCLKQSFDFHLLEKLGLLLFEHNWVYINASLPDETMMDSVHESIKPIINFVKDIESIKTGKGHLAPISFAITQKNFDKIIPHNYIFEYFKVKIDKQSELITITISENGWQNGSLINKYFWKYFVQQEDQDLIRQKYYGLRQCYSNVIGMVSNKKILKDDEEQAFIAFCKKSMLESSLLNLSFEQYQNLLLSNRYFDLQLFSTTRNININNSDLNRRKDEISQTPRTLEQVISSYKNLSKKTFLHDIELIEWGNRNDSMFYNSLACSSLYSIIDYDVFYVSVWGVASSGELDKLFVEAKENTVLRHLLLNEVFFRNSNSYNLYLLSKPESFIAGFYRILNQVREKYRSNNNEFEKVIDNIVELLCNTTINIAIDNHLENDLSILIIFLAKRGIDNNANDDRLEKSCLDFFLTGAAPELLIKLYPSLLIHIKTLELDYLREKHVLYILFKMLEHSNEKLLTSNQEIIAAIEEEVTEHYKLLFKSSLTSTTSCLDSEPFYDDLFWAGLNKSALIDKFIKLVPTHLEMVKGFSAINEVNPIQYSQTIKNYLQVLVNLTPLSQSNKGVIATIIKDIVCNFGFKSEDISFPIFDEPYNYSEDQDYNLWDQLIYTFNEFNDEQFNEFLRVISPIAPLSAMLSFQTSTYINNRRDKILAIIDEQDYSNDSEMYISTIERSFSLALEASKLDLAEVALRKAEHFFENHRYKNQLSVQEMIFKWNIYKFQYELLTYYFESNDVLEDKEKLIRDKRVPSIDESYKQNHSFKHWTKQAVIFQRYIIGLLSISENPTKANSIFDQLFIEVKSSLFSHLIFTSTLQKLIKEEAPPAHFNVALSDYKSRNVSFLFETLSLNYKSDYLYALFLAERYDEVNYLCSKLNTLEVNFRPITITYSKVLNIKGNYVAAQELIDNYKKYHSIVKDDTELEEQISIIAASIKEKLEPLQREMMRTELVTSHKSNNELRTIFREIREKPIHDLASILAKGAERSVNNFLYVEVLACARELLTRSKNLGILNKNKNENLVNDWYVSLLNNRLSWFGITVCDQKRIGTSERGFDVGETDGLILDTWNNPLSIVEAMNLNAIDNTIINKHLNKITDYDFLTLSPVFIISYCYFSDFISKGKKYLDSLKTKQYKGFRKINSTSHTVKELILDSKLITAVEERYREDKKVTIYHLLIDLKI